MGADATASSIDKYALIAQAAPAALVALPTGIAVAAWFPKDLSTLGIIGGLIVTCGAAVPLAQFARTCGKQVERNGLFDSVGGLPTTRFLRHCSDRLNPQTRRRYHAKLTQLLPDTCLPNAEEEEADQEAADNVYASCVDLLREQTREQTQFPVVYAANIAYGFRRNSLGIRRLGIAASVAGTLLCLLRLLFYARSELVSIALIGSLLDALLLFWWWRIVCGAWVMEAADDYAERLLGACDKLPVPQPTPAQTPLRP